MAEGRQGFSLLGKTGLAAYGIFCLVLFVFIRFPYDTFRGRMEQSLGSAINQQVSLGHIRPGFPLGLRVDSLAINKQELTTDFFVKPHLFSLLSGRYGMDMKAVFPTGSLYCSFDTPMNKSRKPMTLLLDFDNFDAGILKAFFRSGSQIRGIINGIIDLEGQAMRYGSMGGKVDLAWSDGFIPLAGLQIPLESLSFKGLELGSTISKGVMTLNRMEITGDVPASMRGSVHLSDQLSRSRMNITGNITLPRVAGSFQDAGQPFMPQGNVRFYLRGTFDSPRFRVAGAAR